MSSSSNKSGKLFEGKTAWFSPTVPSKRKKEWFQKGGQVDEIEEADFIFSNTFDGDIVNYFSERPGFKARYPVTIFHPEFIHACVIKHSFKAVPIGTQIVLPQPLSHLLLPEQDCQKSETEANDCQKTSSRMKTPIEGME